MFAFLSIIINRTYAMVSTTLLQCDISIALQYQYCSAMSVLHCNISIALQYQYCSTT